MDEAKTSVFTIEHRQYLFHTWINITYTLIFTGHAQALSEALDVANSTLNCGQVTVDGVQHHLAELFANASAAGIGQLELSRFNASISTVFARATTNNHQNVATRLPNVNLGWNPDPSPCRDGPQTTTVCPSNLLLRRGQPVYVGDIGGAEDTEIGSDDEDNDDCDMDDLFEIPPDLVSESADLSQCRSGSLPQTIKDAPAMKEPFLASHHSPTSQTFALAKAGPLQTSASRQIHTPIPTLPMLSTSDQSQPSNTMPGPNVAAGQHTSCHAVRQAGFTDEASRSSRPSRTQRNTKGLAKPGQSRKRKKRPPFPLSDKRDLTQADIRPVAECLTEDGTLSPNRKSFHEPWPTSLSATFDTVHYLGQNRKRNRLKLRHAYIHLTRSINVLEATINRDLASGGACRNPALDVGRAASGIAIKAYLDAKENTSEMTLSRSQLSELIRIGKRWSWLAGPTPFLLSVYSRLAETIIDNYSITEPSLKALGAEIQYICPDLVRTLTSESEEFIGTPPALHKM